MFNVTTEQISSILNDFSIKSDIKSFIELQRDDYEEYGSNSKKVRLIIKVDLHNHLPIVIRFKNEVNVTVELIEAQSNFAFLLGTNGIETPVLYTVDGHFAKWYSIGEYDVIVTVEQFVDNEIGCVDISISELTGELLAEMHNVSEKNNCHICAKVLFDPMTSNDLFGFEKFKSFEDKLIAVEPDLYKSIIDKYDEYMKVISAVCNEPRYAVQGDISLCNTYITNGGKIGIFDFNWCGDNNLYFDAIMQAIFEAWLMDYPESYRNNHEAVILPAFLKGYNRKRPFSKFQKDVYPYLYAIISAFELGIIRYDDNSLWNAIKKEDNNAVSIWLKEIYKRICTLSDMPLMP